jgi:hypothetical protein
MTKTLFVAAAFAVAAMETGSVAQAAEIKVLCASASWPATVLALRVDAPVLVASTIDLVGQLPAEIQNYSLFAAGIGERGRQPEAIRAPIKLITSPDAIPVLKAQGIEPG